MSFISSTSFKTFCISACIFIILINLSINIVLGLQIFPTMKELNPGENIVNVSGVTIEIVSGNLLSLLYAGETALGTILSVGAVLYGFKTGNWNILAVAIFATVFWSLWINNIALITSAASAYSFGVFFGVYGLLTVPMFLIFAGAVISILGGTE